MALAGATVVVGAKCGAREASGVNANQVDYSAYGAGAADVFVRDGGGVWSQQAYLKASNTDAHDQFRSPVSVSGDPLGVGARLAATTRLA